MRAVSLRSLKFSPLETGRSQRPIVDQPRRELDFAYFVEDSCKQFNCPMSVSVFKEIQQDFSKGGKQKLDTKMKRKSIIKRKVIEVSDTSSSTTSVEQSEPIDDQTVVITAIHDSSNRLVEINMTKYRYLPIAREIFEVIALIVPYHKLLTKFTIKQCRIDMYTIYELSKILPISNITDVCLDQSLVKEGNYDILLCETSRIQNLSLCRCNINDIVCERIAARLRYREPAEITLLTLNLSSNHITDAGAKQLGEVLRTNRHLRYLNISDNHIGDDGAHHILDALTEFPMNNEEILEHRRRYAKYLKKKRVLYDKCVRHLAGIAEDSATTKKTSRKVMNEKSTTSMASEKTDESSASLFDECITKKAEIMVADLMGPFEDPFCRPNVKVKNGQTYSVGNLTLCYLNMGYNNLTYQTVEKLLKVVSHQQTYTTQRMCGLLNVVIKGNCIPSDCTALKALNAELLKHTTLFAKRHTPNEKKIVLSSRN